MGRTGTMTDILSIAFAQLNPTVGDIAGNIAALSRARAAAARQGADLVVATELGVAGYPPEDLVLKPALWRGRGCGQGFRQGDGRRRAGHDRGGTLARRRQGL